MNRYEELRLALFDCDENNIRTVKECLRRLKITDIQVAEDFSLSFDSLKYLVDADVVVVHWTSNSNDPLNFCRSLRFHPRSPNRFVPIIMISEMAIQSAVEAARDAGVDEFLTRPFSARSLEERLHMVVYQRRGFVRTDEFFGPDRRRGAMARMLGTERRSEPTELIDPATGTAYLD